MSNPKSKEEVIASVKRVKSEWLAEFKLEFSQRTGISWNEDAGFTNEDAWRHFPDDVTEVVSHIIEKYDLIEQ
jgi:hypothetical protein